MATPTLLPETLQYLRDLAANNHRDWFQSNKDRYESAKQNVEVFLDALIDRIGTFDPAVAHHSAKDCMFRIYRDVRFSKDKSPYKTHFGAHITAAEKRSDIHTRAGYYVHLEPGGTFLAGGAYLPQGDWLKAIRREIDLDAQKLRAILQHPDFQQYFGEMEGETLKTAPRDYPKDHPEIDLLRHKSFLASHACPDHQVIQPEFLDHCETVFRALHPFDQFLNQALEV